MDVTKLKTEKKDERWEWNSNNPNKPQWESESPLSRQTRLTGGGGKGTRLTSLSLIRHSKANMEKRNIFEKMLIQVRSSSISMENIQTLQIKSNSYSKSPSGFTLEKTLYCLSQCCLRPDNNLQFQNILTPQLSLSALAICLSWKQFIVNNYSRIVILKLAWAQLYQAPILQQKQHEDVN